MSRKPVTLNQDLLFFTGLMLVGAALAYIDNRLHFHTILVETVHALVVTTILIFCLICQRRYPEVKRYGWNVIVWGTFFLMIGSWVDILDDPPVVALLKQLNFDYGRSWQQAFVKKILGYTAGISLIAYGFFQWIPWMIETRLNVEKLNQRLSHTNKNMNRILMSLDEHVESERLSISRELHDDVAQQLTFLNIQLQLCQKELGQSVDKAKERLTQIREDVTETLRSVRQISQDLRPESLFALGLIPAMEQFLEKLRSQMPETQLKLTYSPLMDEEQHTRIESRFSDRELLHVFRLLQEGVRNALKHSKARHIEVKILESETQFRFQIVDDGVGLPWETPPTDDTLVQQGHLGLAGMRERAREISGTMTLRNREQTQGALMEIGVDK